MGHRYIISVTSILILSCVVGDTQHKLENSGSFENVILEIRASSFEKIVNSKSPFFLAGYGNENGSNHILNTFTKFQIPFDFSSILDESYQQLKRICKATANYNRRHFGSYNEGGNHLEILISLVPHGGFTEQALLVAAVIQETNSSFNNTITAFLINYRFQRLGLQSLVLVNNDIKIAHQILKSVLTGGLIGVILDVRNCYGSDRHFSKLELKFLDIILFRANDGAEESLEFFLGSRISCGFRMIQILPLESPETLPLYGSTVPVPSQLSFENITLSFNRTRLVQLAQPESGDVVIFMAETSEYQRKHSADPVTATLKARNQWLKHDSIFNLDFTGTSVMPDTMKSRNHPDGLIPLIWSTFCKILVHDIKQAGSNQMDYKMEFVEKLLNYRKKERQRCDHSATEILIAANVFQDVTHSECHGRNMDTLVTLVNFSAILQSNYSNILTTILLNWNGYLGQAGGTYDNFLSRLRNEQTLTTPLVLAPIIRNTKRIIDEMRFNVKPKVGIMLDWRYSFDFFEQSRHIVEERKSVDIKAVDMFVFTTRIHKDTIVSKGALKTSIDTAASLQYCKSVLLFSVVAANLSLYDLDEPASSFYVSIYGCHTSSSNISELAEVARFWELMSQWALSVETTVIIGPAVEIENSPHPSTNCSAQNVNMSAEACGCGWWRAYSTGQDAKATNQFMIESKKSIASKLLRQADRLKPTKDSEDHGPTTQILLPVLVPCSIISVAIMCVAIVLIRRYRSKQQLIRTEIENFFKGNCSVEKIQNNAEACDTAQSQPYDKERYELSPSHFQIDFARRLGCGEFSYVYSGTVKLDTTDIRVAVKTVKEFEGKDMNYTKINSIRGLISEIKILAYIGHHRNVINLIGAHTSKLIRGKVFVFLEVCDLGSLLTVLRTNAKIIGDWYNDSGIGDTNDGGENEQISRKRAALPVELYNDLHRWSKDIASGMEYISSKNIVHSDLAARNVLLDSARCAKISDFGLSRRLYDYTEYLKQSTGPLPWKWMAPESLTRLVFNEKTDVWAFGVTLWEIFSLGDEPYPGLSWDVNFPRLLERGLRLNVPRYNQKNMYNVMQNCWNVYPEDRPTFAELTSIFCGEQYITIS